MIRPFANITTEDVENEARAVDKLCARGHRNVVQVLFHGWLKGSPYYVIDMEFCELTLAEYIDGNPSVVAKLSVFDFDANVEVDEAAREWYNTCQIMQDVLNGISFIHSSAEVHRDLKPSNSYYLYATYC